MIIRCYGARGSIPVSGKAYDQYGGDTTCLEIRSKNDEIIIVDAGTGIRRLGTKLLREERYTYHIIFTHSHLDHIIGFPFFKPIYDDRTVINMLGCPTTQGNLKKLLTKSMAAPFFPFPFDNLNARINYSIECGMKFHIDSIEAFAINLSHPNVGNGYKFVEDNKSFVFLTDNELGYRHKNGKGFNDYVKFSREADLLFHDAEYTPEEYPSKKTWGHSHFKEAVDLALAAGVKTLGLFHHNQDRTDVAQNAMVKACDEYAGQRQGDLKCFGVHQGFECEL